MKIRRFASAILIAADGRLLFQQRDNDPTIRYPGMVGLFGGHVEGDETSLECVRREVREEIGYEPLPEAFEKMADYSAIDPDGCRVSGVFFVARDIPTDALTITEGALLAIEFAELPSLIQQFEPAARAAARIYLNNRWPT